MNLKLLKETLIAKKRLVLPIIFLLFINIVSFVYLTFYQEPRVASLQSSWFEKRQKSSQMSVLDAATIYAQGKRDLQTWHSRILSKNDFARMLGELFETASNNSLVVNNVTYKPTSMKEQGLLAYTIDFSVSGNYAGMKSFISDLMRSRQIILLDNLSLANASQTKEDVQLKLKLITYFRMEGP
ncbi:type II secretion system protein PulO, putative [Geotalea daltonii FRC-32]|uniref:Type II secretion system protein PulO, putative n=1 Tax=Geotalea daltonii (strain DSM 22248 / JCM 15807 / FRC-32) TaxID=316067 RepID=B9M0Z3_GEODF|nr:type 4a pilus biogenesis protein PilO [Geotalea daltonii]ACM20996.1 type II secretion system protein PulO, putative [Geotalea daltonii FRC-32]